MENLLLSNQGTIKLCDFGSATTISHYPDYSWSAQRRALVEEEVSRVARGALCGLLGLGLRSRRCSGCGRAACPSHIPAFASRARVWAGRRRI